MAHPALKHVLQPHFIVSLTAIVGAALVAITFLLVGRAPASAYVSPTQGPLTQEVDTSGSVKPAESIDLSFQATGRIARVSVSVGQSVARSQTLAALDGSALVAGLNAAKAALALQEANLQSLQQGARPEDVAVSQTAVSGAQSTLAQANSGVISSHKNAYVQSDDAVRNRVDQFFTNPRGANPSLAFILSDSQLQSSLESDRAQIEKELNSWQAELAAIPTDQTSLNVGALSIAAETHLDDVGAFLDQVSLGLTKAVPNPSYSSATITTFQTSVSTARSNIATARSALVSADTTQKADAAALSNAQSQLTLKQAGPTGSALAAQQAQVQAAQAAVDAAQANLNNTVIVAPIAGTITVNNAHVGATASAGLVEISMDSNAQFQVEAYVSETEVAKIAVGNSAEVSFDAYASASPLSARVIGIDPAATIQNGVASYKITLQFDQNDPSERAGLTANVKISTANKPSALSVPSSAIITKGAQQYVLKQGPQGDELAPITTGISSDTGMTEVLSGITTSDHIRAFGAQ